MTRCTLTAAALVIFMVGTPSRADDRADYDRAVKTLRRLPPGRET
jgi:hypothetical protein